MAKTILIVLFSFVVLNTNGQDSKKVFSTTRNDSIKSYVKEWSNFGLGSESKWINVGINYNWHPKRFTYQAGYSASATLFGDNTYNYFNVGIGKSLIKRRAIVSLTAGPGLLWGRNNSKENFSNSRYMNLGLQANAGVIVKVVRNFGLGLEFYGRLYRIQSSAGFRVVLHLNNFKWEKWTLLWADVFLMLIAPFINRSSINQ